MTSYLKPAFSLAEVILAIAIFALIATAIVTLALGSMQASQKVYEQNQAVNLARQGIELVNYLAAANWPVYSGQKTSLSWQGNAWSLAGEGTTEQLGSFVRTIEFFDVCRDPDTLELLSCPQAPVDSRLRKVVVHIKWTGFNGRQLGYDLSSYLHQQ
ncbi:MAG: type II secretion system protein [Candidatus Falkowbacteria bacterium]